MACEIHIPIVMATVDKLHSDRPSFFGERSFSAPDIARMFVRGLETFITKYVTCVRFRRSSGNQPIRGKRNTNRMEGLLGKQAPPVSNRIRDSTAYTTGACWLKDRSSIGNPALARSKEFALRGTRRECRSGCTKGHSLLMRKPGNTRKSVRKYMEMGVTLRKLLLIVGKCRLFTGLQGHASLARHPTGFSVRPYLQNPVVEEGVTSSCHNPVWKVIRIVFNGYALPGTSRRRDPHLTSIRGGLCVDVNISRVGSDLRGGPQ